MDVCGDHHEVVCHNVQQIQVVEMLVELRRGRHMWLMIRRTALRHLFLLCVAANHLELVPLVIFKGVVLFEAIEIHKDASVGAAVLLQRSLQEVQCAALRVRMIGPSPLVGHRHDLHRVEGFKNTTTMVQRSRSMKPDQRCRTVQNGGPGATVEGRWRSRR